MTKTVDYGIDLGTTNSCIARWEGGSVRVFQNNDQMNVTPSAVHILKTGRVIVGRQRDHGLRSAEHTNAIVAAMVSGLTPSQIQDLLAEKLHRFLSVAQVTVTVAEIKSKVVYITGEINKPGVYPIITPTDVLQLIIKAGGLTPFARSKSIVILRVADGKQQKLTVNYKKLLQGAYLDQNIFLLPGDTVVVP